jgi:hypothetical protein
MAQTVIGVFDSDPAAEQAVQNLLAVGVDSEGIHVHTQPSEIGAMTHPDIEAEGAPKLEHESLLDKVEHFFATLVGDDAHPPEFYHYREVVRRGGALVSVCVRDESQLPVVFTVFETSGARDIDEHAAQWKTDLQDDASMSSRAVPAPEASDAAVPGNTAPDARRQNYRVYPGALEAGSSSSLSDADSLRSPEQGSDAQR